MKRTVIVLLVTLMLGGLIYYICTHYSLKPVLNLRIQTSGYILILFIVSILIGQYAMKVILNDMNVRVTLKKLFPILMVTYAFNLTNPIKLGIPMRVFLFKKLLNIPLSVGTASVTLMNSLWIVPPIFISIFGFGKVMRVGSNIFYLEIMLLFVFIFVFYFLLFRVDLSTKLSMLPWKSRIFLRLLRFISNFQLRIQKVSLVCILSVLALVTLRLFCIACVSFLILRDLECHVSPFQALYVQSVSFIIGLVSMLPMGLGSKDVSLVLLLSRIGVSEEIAVSLAVIERVIWAVLPLVLGLISGISLGLNLKELKKDASTFLLSKN